MASGTLTFTVDVVDYVTPVMTAVSERVWQLSLALLDEESRRWYEAVANYRWRQRPGTDGFNEAQWWAIRQSVYATRWAIDRRRGLVPEIGPSRVLSRSRELAVRPRAVLA